MQELIDFLNTTKEALQEAPVELLNQLLNASKDDNFMKVHHLAYQLNLKGGNNYD